MHGIPAQDPPVRDPRRVRNGAAAPDNPRRAFGPGRRTLYWDDLISSTSADTMWCYLTLPFLLLGPGVNIERCRQDSDGRRS